MLAEKTYAEDLHLVSHQNGMHAVLRLVPLDPATGERAETRVEATPGLLSWTGAGGRVDLAYESPDTVRLRGEGLALRITAAARTLTPFSGTYFFRDPAAGAYVFTSYETGRRYRVTVLSGAVADAFGSQALGSAERGLTVTADADGGPGRSRSRNSTPPAAPTPRRRRSARSSRPRGAAFADFADAVAPWRSSATPAAELAAYVLWSATVGPAGLRHPARGTDVQALDGQGLELGPLLQRPRPGARRPELAWDQFQLPFDHQDESGALPDSVTHSEVLHNFVKPPIHGWALRPPAPTAAHAPRTGPN